MGYFPFFIEITGKKGLVVGGGRIAAHKVEKLLPFQPVLTVTAPEILPELLENTDLICTQRPFREEDLEGQFFVIAASDSRELNTHIAGLCREKGILVNVVDQKEDCGFLFPSLVKEGKLTVGISTEGTSPQMAADLRSQVAQAVPSSMEQILDQLSALRVEAKERMEEAGARTAFLKKAALFCMQRNRTLTKEEIENLYAECQKVSALGSVTLVGAGCGAFDLITVRGLNAIKRAQVLIYDDLIDERLLAHAPESCEKIYAGKRSGRHSMPQEEINALLIEKAKQGKQVVRLKGGDSFVFGRGGEEVLALREAGIEVSVIPGITSAIAVPEAAGIPVTHREAARSFHVITGHISGQGEGPGKERFSENLKALAALDGTLVFLMGFAHLREICEKLAEYGKSMSTPAAVVHGNFDESVFAIRGTLGDIADKVEASEMKTPAVIIIGETAGMDFTGCLQGNPSVQGEF